MDSANCRALSEARKARAGGKIVRMALSGEVPERAVESDFMRSYGASREAEDGIFVGHSDVRKMELPSTIIYTPEGYISQ